MNGEQQMFPKKILKKISFQIFFTITDCFKIKLSSVFTQNNLSTLKYYSG